MVTAALLRADVHAIVKLHYRSLELMIHGNHLFEQFDQIVMSCLVNICHWIWMYGYTTVYMWRACVLGNC